VEHEKDGLVCDGSAESLFRALDRLASDRRLAHRMGLAARETAATRYSLEAQATAVKAIYERVLIRGG